MSPEPNGQSSTLLSVQTVDEYLIARGIFDPTGAIEARELGGGVSNLVLAARQGGLRVVVKQALERLRVPDEWLARRERAITESEALRLAARIAPGSVPEVIDLDREACVLTLSEAPADWGNWKEKLLSGEADPRVAARLGELLAVWHTETFEDRNVAREFGSSQAFDELRIDPYYRTVGRRRAELSSAVDGLVQRMRATRLCLVHGDYSPKNVLVGSGLWVIDFEVAHYGDPAFDLAFMLSHLLLKRLHVPQASSELKLCAEAFWGSYERVAAPLCAGRCVCVGSCRLSDGCACGRQVACRIPHRRPNARLLADRLRAPVRSPGNVGEAFALLERCRVAASRQSWRGGT